MGLIPAVVLYILGFVMMWMYAKEVTAPKGRSWACYVLPFVWPLPPLVWGLAWIVDRIIGMWCFIARLCRGWGL